MVIDFHVHFYPPKVAEKAVNFVKNFGIAVACDGTRQGLEESMQSAGIDLAVGLAVVNNPLHSRRVNQFAIDNNNGVFRMFGSVHPSEEKPLDTLNWIYDSGLYGMKIHPEYQNFCFEDESLFPLCERCIELDFPVITHCGADPAYSAPYKTNPEKLLAFHRRFPELKLILAHLGSYLMWEEVFEHLMGSNLYLELSTAIEEADQKLVKKIIQAHGSDKIMLGSDAPWYSQQTMMDNLKELNLTSEQFDDITHKTALKFLQR